VGHSLQLTGISTLGRYLKNSSIIGEMSFFGDIIIAAPNILKAMFSILQVLNNDKIERQKTPAKPKKNWIMRLPSIDRIIYIIFSSILGLIFLPVNLLIIILVGIVVMVAVCCTWLCTISNLSLNSVSDF